MFEKKWIANLLIIGFIWVSESFNAFNDAMNFMNSLSEKQKESAYIVAYNSNRSSVFTGYYGVIYKKEVQ